MSSKVELNGKVFDNPGPLLVTAANRALLDIAVMGAVRVQSKMTGPGKGRVTGFLRGRVSGSIVSSLHAQIDAGEARYGRNVVYAGWVEGVSSRNRSRPGFPGHFYFKDTFQWLSRGPKEVKEMLKNAIYEVFS
ncbi:hypothetical protein [uncultured Mediterranean phage uvDeep-CGR2-KM18-C74]|nr:hypothetical protein [uncultured Mediterranean phage uvDeep-CGR2-KM18-C74]